MRFDSSAALVISLDFELHWGVRDFKPLDAAERARLISARQIIPRILDLFDAFDIHATWAIVGFLFADSKTHMRRFIPDLKPNYARQELNPYSEPIGANELDDPFHFAPSLIREISRHSGQEIATHSFSHYYCLEKGQTVHEFEADLQSAVAIAADSGYALTSYVFPRNQVEEGYLQNLKRTGLGCYRGAEPAGVNEPRSSCNQQRFYYRAGRLVDSYLNLFGAKTHPLRSEGDLVSISGSRYLSPYRTWLKSFESLRLQRIVQAMEHAASTGEIFHLWWHPEDFAYNCDFNMRFLRSVIVAFDHLRKSSGMKSFSMAEAKLMARASAETLALEME